MFLLIYFLTQKGILKKNDAEGPHVGLSDTKACFFYLTTFPPFLPRFTFPFIKLRQRGFLHLGFGLLCYCYFSCFNIPSLLDYLLWIYMQNWRFLTFYINNNNNNNNQMLSLFLQLSAAQLWITLYLVYPRNCHMSASNCTFIVCVLFGAY